jgi:xanthine dehydrogenase accessory factor
MTDMRDRAEELRTAKVPFVHARVVLAERPTSAKPGDEAIVMGDGTIEGFVGGQCAESTIRAQGLGVLEKGEPRLVRIAPVPEPGQPGKTVVHNPCLSGGTLEIFLEPVLPSPVVVVLGEAPIARAISSVGAALGYDVHLRAADSAADAAGLAGVDAVVVASHGAGEEQALLAALAAEVPYIGLIASPKRGNAVLDSLDISCCQRGRVHTPAGLDLGARTAPEIALSVFAQIIAERPRAARADATPADAGGADAGGAGTGSAGTAIDPVCGMTVAAVDSTLHVDMDGVRTWFCCPGCRDSFVAASLPT